MSRTTRHRGGSKGHSNRGSGKINTDDFTPEQALTRLAYKVHGEILAVSQ